MKRLERMMMSGVLLALTAAPLTAQRRDDRYYNGMHQGYRGGYNDQYDHRRYDSRNEYDRSRGGIGPGKGALIGGAGGAVLGAVFGGGLKGALIGGGAGAGVGAIAGKVHQDHQRNDWRDHRNR